MRVSLSGRGPAIQQRQSIAFIGGTGQEGLGLALRFAAAGRAVNIGSRSAERAQEAAAKIKAALPKADVRGLTNLEAAEGATILVITVPYEAQAETLKGLRQAAAGKTVIDTVVPMRFDKGAASVVAVAEGSAAQQAAALLPEAHVVAAFHHLSAPKLAALDHDVPGDVIVCGDHPEAKAVAIGLAGCIAGCRGIDGGGLANARHVEAFTAVLLGINRTYKTGASLKITGV